MNKEPKKLKINTERAFDNMFKNNFNNTMLNNDMELSYAMALFTIVNTTNIINIYTYNNGDIELIGENKHIFNSRTRIFKIHLYFGDKIYYWKDSSLKESKDENTVSKYADEYYEICLDKEGILKLFKKVLNEYSKEELIEESISFLYRFQEGLNKITYANKYGEVRKHNVDPNSKIKIRRGSTYTSVRAFFNDPNRRETSSINESFLNLRIV